MAAGRAYSRHDGEVTPLEIDDHLSSEHISELKACYYSSKVAMFAEEIAEIEMDTREQSGSNRWMTERHLRLTVSSIGSISKMQRKIEWAKKVEAMLYFTFEGSDATRYGSLMGESAWQDYIWLKFQRLNGHPGLTTKRCGLVVSRENPWLAASPDDEVLDQMQPLILD